MEYWGERETSREGLFLDDGHGPARYNSIFEAPAYVLSVFCEIRVRYTSVVLPGIADIGWGVPVKQHVFCRYNDHMIRMDTLLTD
jgi:hypothetical protein